MTGVVHEKDRELVAVLLTAKLVGGSGYEVSSKDQLGEKAKTIKTAQSESLIGSECCTPMVPEWISYLAQS